MTAKKKFSTPRARWQAVVSRDSRADGHFLYAVRSTGIYCRPSCASRLPLPENIGFYPSCEKAEAAGFRACKRCRPEGPGLKAEYEERVAKACRLIEEAEKTPDLGSLAKAVGMSPFHFHRIFRALTGLTPKAYAVSCRRRLVREEIKKGRTVTEAIYQVGFQSSGRFYAKARATLGMDAARYRRRGEGCRIRYALEKSSLGQVLVAASDEGICAVSLGEDGAQLERELREQFSGASFVVGDRAFARTVRRVIALVEAPGSPFDLPLDVKGTVFQEKVWQALREIPGGETLSYTELARKVGLPKAIRAVASACAANKIAVAIPCHRILRQSGDLSGYRWGLERKAALLEREKKA